MFRDVLGRSTDECNLDVAGCVLLPPAAPDRVPQAVRPPGGHHTGQALHEIDGTMPIYCPNTSNPTQRLAGRGGSSPAEASGSALKTGTLEGGDTSPLDPQTPDLNSHTKHAADAPSSEENSNGAAGTTSS